MGGLFGKPSVPTIVTSPPKKTDAEIAKAAADARMKLRRRQGHESTILTPLTAETQGRTILGA